MFRALQFVALLAFAWGIIVKDPVDEYKQPYKVSYEMEDPITEDSKDLPDDMVLGTYSLIDPDGTFRTVRYLADHDGLKIAISRKSLLSKPIRLYPELPLIAKLNYPEYYKAVTNKSAGPKYFTPAQHLLGRDKPTVDDGIYFTPNNNNVNN